MIEAYRGPNLEQIDLLLEHGRITQLFADVLRKQQRAHFAAWTPPPLAAWGLPARRRPQRVV